MKKILLLSILVCSSGVSAKLPTHNGDLITLTNGHYSILYNCEKRGYEHYNYITRPDTGNAKRKSGFFHDERLPKRCRQFSVGSYKTHGSHPKFDRGHGVPVNHFDYNQDIADSTNSFSNVVPHSAPLNRRGLWRYTDKLIECERENGPVEVYGGVIWGEDVDNDYFVKSHGITTPDYLYKIIIKANGDMNAWVMPNSPVATESTASRYLVSVSEIEKLTGAIFEINKKHLRAKSAFVLPKSCDLS